VLNGTATSGLAASVADLLRAEGFGVGDVGNEQGTVNATVVRYGPGGEDKARTVAAAVPGAEMEPSDAIGDAVQLVLGPGYETVTAVTVPSPKADSGTGGEVPPAGEPAPVAPPAPVSC
jgi:hypothetical protein